MVSPQNESWALCDCSRRIRMSGYTLIEVLCALAILGMLAAAFHASVGGIMRSELALWRETRCLIVMGNVIERLSSMDCRNRESVAVVLAEELAASDLPSAEGLVGDCVALDDGLSLRIRASDGKVITEIHIPSRPARSSVEESQ